MPLCIVTICIFLFKPENDLGFGDAFPLITLFFLIHAFAPVQVRPLLFIGFGVLTLFHLMGWSSAVLFFLIVIAVFKLLDYPMKIYFRIAGLILILSVLYFSRREWIDIPFLGMIFPFFGTLFMFRSISYLYERSVTIDNTPLLIRFSYFFSFPNFFFLLFPILDYKKYPLSWYAISCVDVYRNAIRHLMIGLFFSLLYRFVYLYIAPDPLYVTDANQLVLFLVTGFILSIRMVGLFYLGIGTLGLFGFSFPDVFGNFFTAESFSVLWQKINVYWRDFVVRVFYYPLYFNFRLKIRREVYLSSVTILVVFFISAVMHSWQQFWITGDFVLRPVDIIYWMSFGFFIAFENLIGFSRIIDKNIALKATSAFLVFLCMLFLYSFWTGSGIQECLFILSRFTVDTKSALIPVGLVVFFYFLFYFITHYFNSFSLIWNRMNIVLLMFFLTLSIIKITTPDTKGLHKTFIEEFSNPAMMNKRDRKRMERGYYSKILNSDDVLRRTAGFRSGESWNPHNYLVRYTGDIIYRELLPDTVLSFKGADIITNSVGLRDKEYSKLTAQNQLRIALLGGSYEMGSGVRQEFDFESLTEKELNRNLPGQEIEIWNYGLGGYGLLQSVGISDQKLRGNQFDYLIYVAHSGEMERIAGDLAFLLKKKVDLLYPDLKHLINLSGAMPSMCDLEIEQRLYPLCPQIFQWGIEKMNAICMQENMIPVLVFLPTLGDVPDEVEKQIIANVSSVFDWNLIDLTSVYDQEYLSDLYLTQWDNHPNERGHEVISAALSYRLLQIIQHKNR